MKEIEIISFLKPRKWFFFARKKAHWEESGGGILLGENTGGGAVLLWPIRFQSVGSSDCSIRTYLIACMLRSDLCEVGLTQDFTERVCCLSRVVSAAGKMLTVWTVRLCCRQVTHQPTVPQSARSLMRAYISLSWSVTARPLTPNVQYRLCTLSVYSIPVTWCTNSLTFNNYTFCPHCIYVFCIYLRTNSDLCHLHYKLIGFCNRDEKCLLRGTKWAFNLLNPNGHVMHQQFNIQQLYILPTLYFCVLYLSENKQRLVPLTA